MLEVELFEGGAVRMWRLEANPAFGRKLSWLLTLAEG